MRAPARYRANSTARFARRDAASAVTRSRWHRALHARRHAARVHSGRAALVSLAGAESYAARCPREHIVGLLEEFSKNAFARKPIVTILHLRASDVLLARST